MKNSSTQHTQTPLQKSDRLLVWHPFTQEKTAPDPIVVSHAKGSYLYDEAGKPYLDLISSWWVNLHGHAHPAIAHGIYEQAQQLEHVIFSGCTHEPAISLCEKLHVLLPNTLNRFFFSDNGSTAVEAALKMAYQYWSNRGHPEKKVFLSLDGAYHGDTFGAMSVGQCPHFHGVFSDLFFEVIGLPYPDMWNGKQDYGDQEQKSLHVLEHILEKRGHEIAAFILEPLVQGASGMRTARAQFFRDVVHLARKNGILIIFDEVMTGFGRTGTLFALSSLNIVPDFLCLSKGLTGGFLPLALTVTQKEIYDAFLSQEWTHAFAHGHSYTANPLACRAALISLDLLSSPTCLQALRDLEKAQEQGLQTVFRKCPEFVEKQRHIGTIGAFDLKPCVNKEKIKAAFLENGLLLRPLNQTVYLIPPYSTKPEELMAAYDTIAALLPQCLEEKK